MPSGHPYQCKVSKKKHIFSVWPFFVIFADMKSLISLMLALVLASQNPLPVPDRSVYDFGTVKASQKELKCSFTLSNPSDAEPLYIYAVVSSCGCTSVDWTREEIAPGQDGVISVTYSNDMGEGLFDKSINVYTSAQKKPFKLRIRGVVEK